MASDRILELLRRPFDVDEYTEIRELWKTHSIAEDNRDLPGLISTLTDDCVYEVMGTGARWEGHEGAGRFYTELLTAFPDIHFDLEYIVIGPQGVCEEARVTATHRGRCLQHASSAARWSTQTSRSPQTATAEDSASGGRISVGRRCDTATNASTTAGL